MDKKLLKIILTNKKIVISYFLLSILNVVFIYLYPSEPTTLKPQALPILIETTKIAIYLTPLFVILMIYFAMLKRYVYKLYSRTEPKIDDKTALKQVVKYSIFWNMVSVAILCLNLLCIVMAFSNNILYKELSFFLSLGLLVLVILLIYLTTYGSVISGIEPVKPYQVDKLLEFSSRDVWIVSFVYYFVMFTLISFKVNPILDFIIMFFMNITCAYTYVLAYIKTRNQRS